MLLKHSTSTSVPATPTRPRHTRVHPIAVRQQHPSAWQAGRSLQNSPFRAGLLEPGPHAVAQGSGWPAASQLAWEGVLLAFHLSPASAHMVWRIASSHWTDWEVCWWNYDHVLMCA